MFKAYCDNCNKEIDTKCIRKVTLTDVDGDSEAFQLCGECYDEFAKKLTKYHTCCANCKNYIPKIKYVNAGGPVVDIGLSVIDYMNGTCSITKDTVKCYNDEWCFNYVKKETFDDEEEKKDE